MLLSLLSLLSLTTSITAQNATVTPVLTPVLKAQVSLGRPLTNIPVPGGMNIIEPLLNGTISGPALNATIYPGGTAVVTVTANGTVATPFVQLYGKSDDGVAFYVTATGVGSPGAQFATLKIDIGGRYAYLANEYILASFTDNAAMTESTIEAWVVTRGA